MLKRKNAILAGAALAAMPMVAHAVTITYSYDLNDFYIATSAASTAPQTLASNFAAGDVTGTGAAPTVYVPTGDFLFIGLAVTVTNNNGLGIAEFQTGLTNSNSAVSTTTPTTAGSTLTSAPVINPFFVNGSSPGKSDGAGGVNPSLGTYGLFIATGQSGLTSAQVSYGANTPAELYSQLRLHVTGASSTSDTYTVNQNIGASYYVVVNTPATTTSLGGSTPATYKNQLFNAATDTVSAMPVLTLKVGSPTTTVATHNIISLTTTTPTLYGSAVTGLTVTGSSQTGYVAAKETITPTQTAYVPVTFNVAPTSGTEVYALKLSSSTDDSTLISDINAQSGTDGVTASAVTGAYTTEFPGYDILLTETGGNSGSEYLGFDLSQDSSAGGITVTAVAAVPEPATVAGLVIGAAGLLLGRRKNKSQTV